MPRKKVKTQSKPRIKELPIPQDPEIIIEVLKNFINSCPTPKKFLILKTILQLAKKEFEDTKRILDKILQEKGVETDKGMFAQIDNFIIDLTITKYFGLDTERIKKEEPHIYEKYQKEITRRNYTVREIKQ